MTAGNRRLVLLAVALSLVSAALSVAQPKFVQGIIDNLGAGRAIGALTWLLLAVVLASVVMSGLQSYTMARTAEAVVRGLRDRLTRKLLSMDIRTHDETNSADLQSRAVADTTLVKSMISAGLIPMFGAIATLVGTVVLMAALDPVLFAITVAAVLVGAIIVKIVSKVARESSLAVQTATGTFSIAVERMLSAIRTVKAFRAEEVERRHVDGESETLWRSGVRLARLQAFIQPAINLCIQGALLVVILVGASRVAAGDMQLGALLAYLMYMIMMIVPISSITQGFTQVQIGMAAVTRIDEVHDWADEQSGDRRDFDDDQLTPQLELEGVTFGYDPTAPALRDVSLQIHRGEQIAVVGPSGAGKSTFIELLERFYTPDSGTVRIDGVDSAMVDLNTYRDRFALVSQDPAVLTGTLRENLTMGDPRISDRQALDALDQVGLVELGGKASFTLDTDLGQHGITLSGGQRQRLAWARALLRDADIVLMDEPSSSLDTITEAKLRRLLADKFSDRTLITVTHRLETIRDADQIVVMSDGGVAAHGTHDELVESSTLYRELVDTRPAMLAA